MTNRTLGYDDLRPLMALQTGDEKHDAASTSTLDVLWVLYDEVLNTAAERVGDPAREGFFLSRGHGPRPYYAVLAAKGFIPLDWLPTFGGFDSPLGYHPDRNLVSGVEVSSGSLGHGLPLAVGAALGLRAQGIGARIVVLVGDAELLVQDQSVAVVLADISVSMFAEAAARHPDRVVNVGLREQLLANVGAGMAMTGMRPVVHTFATFLVERGFEQVKLGFAHQGVGGVLVSAGASFDVSRGGRTHQAPGDVALLGTLPDWAIHVPGHPDEVDTLLRAAVAGDGIVYLRTSTQQNMAPMPVDDSGRMVVVRRGTRGTVVAVGPMLDQVLSGPLA